METTESTGTTIERNFSSHQMNTEKLRASDIVRENTKNLASIIAANVPNGRERAIAMTKLEEVMFFANAGIARN
jgi:hypothetical protein